MLNNLVITQRGFIAYQNNNFVKSNIDPKVKTLTEMKFGRPITSDDSDFYYNLNITNIYNELINTPNALRNFDFRERALKIVLECFDFKSFYWWCNQQNESNFFTVSHKRFINDTFRYIATGTRSVSVTSWIRLLDLHYRTEKDSVVKYEINDYFNDESINCIPGTLPEVIGVWTSHDEGFNDLITFCYIVFGKHEVYIDGNRKFY